MSVLIVLLCTFACSIQNVFVKQYNMKSGGGKFTFSLFSSVFALIFFLITAKDICFSKEVVPYSLAFAVCYIVASVTLVFAVKVGSLALTSLFFAYSLIIPTINGLLFLGDDAGIFQYIGITALLISIYLVRAQKDENDNKKFSVKWLVYVVLGFITNGLCSVIQNAQKLKFQGEQDKNFMIISLIAVVIMFAIATLIADRKTFIHSVKYGLLYGALNGVANGTTNYLVLVSLAFVPSSIFFPIISAGGILLTFIFSCFIYKEKFIPRQIIGLIFGIVALVFLNI